MASSRGGVRAVAGTVGAVIGAAATPFVVGLLPAPRCDDMVAAACATRQVTVGWLVACAATGAMAAVVVALVAHRLRR